MNGSQGKKMFDDVPNAGLTIGTGQEKRCITCGKLKLLNEFHRDKKTKDGCTSECKTCASERNREWYTANSERRKEASQRWQADNFEKVRKYIQRWQTKNPEKRKEYRQRSDQKRYSTPKGKLSKGISKSMRQSLNGTKNGKHWEDLVGYSTDDLKKHLEKKFQPGMTWNNYGEWHLDHRVPISVFNFETPEDIDFKKCWALKNLQPMWAIENVKKSNKLDKPFQPSFSFKGPIKVD